MRERFLIALAVTGGAYAIAFVSPAWTPSTKRQLPKGGGSLNAQTLTLDVASYMIPHPEKAAKGGEDAFFVLEHDMGVFDGVGGWAALGHDAGVFTRGFAEAVAANITAQRIEEAVAARQSQDEGRGKPRLAKGVDLQQALEYATRHAPGTGTCTACVVTFDPVYGMLNGLNIGDSGALLIRRDARGTPFIALKTASQRHKFNQPFQLGTGSRDKARDAKPFLFYVREGDMVVLATDGVLDNMYEDDIIRCIFEASERSLGAAPSTFLGEAPLELAELAGALAQRAYDLSFDKERLSPWEEEAVAAGIIPSRDSGNESPPAEGWPGLNWDVSQWGLALGRAMRSGMNSVRLGNADEGAEGDDSSESKMSAEDVLDFRGGKVDDITVVVAAVRREGYATAGKGTGDDNRLAATDGVGAHAEVDARNR